MMQLHNDDELFDMMRRELFSAVVGDVMDQISLTHQFLSPRLQPLRDDMVVVGRVMPVLVADYLPSEDGHNDIGKKPFGLMLEALDDLKKNEVYFATGSSPRYALWGELMSTRAMKLGAAGAVLDGYSRDTPGILRLNFPTFSYGRYAQDQGVRGKVLDFRIAVEAGEVRIDPGDIIFGDLDGVVIIPQKAERDVIGRALDKVHKENQVRTAIEEGMPSAEAFRTYGVM